MLNQAAYTFCNSSSHRAAYILASIPFFAQQCEHAQVKATDSQIFIAGHDKDAML
jgi:hypothetical protein